VQDKSCTPRSHVVAYVEVQGAVGAGQVLHPTVERRCVRRGPRRGRCRTSPAPHGRTSLGTSRSKARSVQDKSCTPRSDVVGYVEVQGAVGAGQVLHPTVARRWVRRGARRGRCRTSPAPHGRTSLGTSRCKARSVQDKSCTPRSHVVGYVEVQGAVGAGQVLHPTVARRWVRRGPRRGRCRTSPAPHGDPCPNPRRLRVRCRCALDDGRARPRAQRRPKAERSQERVPCRGRPRKGGGAAISSSQQPRVDR